MFGTIGQEWNKKETGQKQQQQQWIKKTKEVTEKITKYGLKFNDSYRFMQSSI